MGEFCCRTLVGYIKTQRSRVFSVPHQRAPSAKVLAPNNQHAISKPKLIPEPTLSVLHAGYMSVHQGTNNNKELRLDKEVHCNIGTVDYQFYSPATHRVTDTFLNAVIALPGTYDGTTKPSYMGFLDYWGTVGTDLD